MLVVDDQAMNCQMLDNFFNLLNLKDMEERIRFTHCGQKTVQIVEKML